MSTVPLSEQTSEAIALYITTTYRNESPIKKKQKSYSIWKFKMNKYQYFKSID